MKEFVIRKNDSGQRVDKFLEKAVKSLPKSLLYKAVRTKRIKLNGKRCECSSRLEEGDVLRIYLNDDVLGTGGSGDGSVSERNSGNSSSENAFAGKNSALAPAPSISIVYEDENILLVHKKPGLTVHESDRRDRAPDGGAGEDTLIRRILWYLYQTGAYDPAQEQSFVPALCNRLDRNTEGIVVAAKNAEALRILNQKIHDRELDKKYLCVTVAPPPKQEDTARAYLFKDERKKQVYISGKSKPGSKTILTQYKTLAQRRMDAHTTFCLAEVGLLTGRTHQIRAHMAYLGAAILGDGKYGSGEVNRRYGVKYQALCAYSLGFHFQTDGGILQYLNGRTFCLPEAWFVERFFPEISMDYILKNSIHIKDVRGGDSLISSRFSEKEKEKF